MMKFLTAIILLTGLLAFAGCPENASKPANKAANKLPDKVADDFNARALEKLYQVLKAKNVPEIEIKGDEIIAGKSRIRLSTVVEYDGKDQGRSVFAVGFETQLLDPDEKNFTVGSIGIGADKKDAQETSIDEWSALFGTALAKLLAGTEETTINGFKIYPGLMGIRGEKPDKSPLDGSPAMNKKIIETLMPVIKKSDQEITSLNLMINIDEAGAITGECRINNQISEELLTALKKLEWEKSAAGYLFKQFYLVKKTKS